MIHSSVDLTKNGAATLTTVRKLGKAGQSFLFIYWNFDYLNHAVETRTSYFAENLGKRLFYAINMKHMEFNLAEKMAIIKSIEDVIMADGRIDNREINFMKQLSYFLNFNMTLIEEARKMNKEEGRLILSGMPRNKKQALSLILREMASADGRVDDEEIAMLHSIFAEAGINI